MGGEDEEWEILLVEQAHARGFDRCKIWSAYLEKFDMIATLKDTLHPVNLAVSYALCREDLNLLSAHET